MPCSYIAKSAGCGLIATLPCIPPQLFIHPCNLINEAILYWFPRGDIWPFLLLPTAFYYCWGTTVRSRYSINIISNVGFHWIEAFRGRARLELSIMGVATFDIFWHFPLQGVIPGAALDWLPENGTQSKTGNQHHSPPPPPVESPMWWEGLGREFGTPSNLAF